MKFAIHVARMIQMRDEYIFLLENLKRGHYSEK